MQKQINHLNFEGQNIYMGFDVHLKSWQVTLMSDAMTLKTFVMPPQPEVLSNYLHLNFPKANYHSAYEAGFSGLWAHYKLQELGINNIVVNAADIPGTQKDKLQKEDKRDSRKIARCLRNGELTPIYTPRLETLNDRSLIRSRSVLVRDMVRFKLRIKSFLYFYGIEFSEEFKNRNIYWSNRFTSWLKEIPMKEESGKQALNALIDEAESQRNLLLRVTKEIKALGQCPKYKDRVKLLRGIPGIGLISAMIILTEVENMDRFPSAEKFASFIGLIPMSQSSGEKEKIGEITFRSHNFLRRTFIESAWVALRMDPALLLAYQHLVKRMVPNNAIVRIAKKLSTRAYGILKNKKEYEYNRTN